MFCFFFSAQVRNRDTDEPVLFFFLRFGHTKSMYITANMRSPTCDDIHTLEWQSQNCAPQCTTGTYCIFQLILSSILPRIRRVPIPWAVIMATIGMICAYLSEKGTISYRQIFPLMFYAMNWWLIECFGLNMFSRIQTLATRYPQFSNAHVASPRPIGAFLFKPECEEIQQIFPDQSDSNQTASEGNRFLDFFFDTRPVRSLRSNQNSSNLQANSGCATTSTAWFNTCVELFQAGLSIAFVSVLETLISAKIASKITRVKCNQRKEVRKELFLVEEDILYEQKHFSEHVPLFLRYWRLG